ncbi:MAG: electron transfer flavoprotein subunit alpha/FixB family protein [Chloroflexi bacterium]|nr:electron transfer flavoprotein subunit alpha/FixB family protein [Chloroflexota bacterium]
MSSTSGVLVVGETQNGRLAPVTAELLGLARSLARGLQEQVAVVLGAEKLSPEAAADAIAYGAETVYTVEHALMEQSPVEAMLAVVERVVREKTPTVVLVGKTLAGSDLGPGLAFRLGVGLAQDCIEVTLDSKEKGLVAVRPVYGGVAMARVALKRMPYVATVRPKAFDPPQRDTSRKGEVVALNPSLDASVARVRVLERASEESAGVRLEDARVVVGGGRGLGGPEPFQMLEELAKLLGGAVGASRAVCDAGWVPYHYQIGLTGKTIAPDLYITVAISGASQHMAGCSGARNIVAINKDRDSNIFKEARFGVVADWKKALPAFAETVKELVKSG